MACSVPNDYAKREKIAFRVFEVELEDSWLPRLNCVLLEVTHAFDRGLVAFGDDPSHRFTSTLLSKLINEGYGLIGCLQKGAFLAAHHNARSSLELSAGYSYVFTEPDEVDKRLRKFFEFEAISKFNMYQQLVSKDPDDDVAASIPEDELNAWRIQLPHWCDLFDLKIKLPLRDEQNPGHGRLTEAEVDPEHLEKLRLKALRKVQSWHYPHQISDMLSSLDDDDAVRGIYGVLSHATHLSPMGANLAGGFPTIGLPLLAPHQLDFRTINRLISAAMIGVQGVLDSAEEHIGLELNIDFPNLDLDP